MIYGLIVKRRIRQSFEQVNNREWDELLESIAPNVHHRFLGTHAIGGERHDRDTLRRWFERLACPAEPPPRYQRHLGEGLAVEAWCSCSGTGRRRCSTADRTSSTPSM